MANGQPDSTNVSPVAHERKSPPPDLGQPPPREKLPAKLQKIVDNEDTLWDEVVDGTAPETTDSNLRYAAYATRIRTILLSAQRYVAYTSDIGESFRPVAHPWLVKGAYGISWAYLTGDVAHEGYKAYTRNERVLHPARYAVEEYERKGEKIPAGIDQLVPGKVPVLEDYRSVMLQRAIFQGVASMGLPAFTIHSIVRYSGKALKNAKNTTIRTYGPIGLGLAAVPFLPYVFDKPVEEAVEWGFYKGYQLVGGEAAVGSTHLTGRNEAHAVEGKDRKAKQKEL